MGKKPWELRWEKEEIWINGGAGGTEQPFRWGTRERRNGERRGNRYKMKTR